MSDQNDDREPEAVAGGHNDGEDDNFEKKSLDEMHQHIQNVLQQMKDKFQAMSEQVLSKIDDMGTRIDDLEKNIADLMSHAGLETQDK